MFLMNPKRGTLKPVGSILDSDHYRSILLLNALDTEYNGLRQIHYRYVLMDDHGGVTQKNDIDKIEYTFRHSKDIIDEYKDYNWIVEGSITSNTNLSNFLKRLSEDPYNLLEIELKDYFSRYRLTPKGFFYTLKWRNMEIVKTLPDEDQEKVYDYLIDLKRNATSQQHDRIPHRTI
jgi:hypothetical protein